MYRVIAATRDDFRKNILAIFGERHRIKPFDVLESPEFGCEGEEVARAYPEVARVVKLHTPTYLVRRASWVKPSFKRHLRFLLGGLRRGSLRWLSPGPYCRDEDPEFHWANSADEVAAPSTSIAQILAKDWGIPFDKLACYGYPFSPSEALLSQALEEKSAFTIGFLGRLEPRKGVLELAMSIGSILRSHPNVKFRFLGPLGHLKNRTW